MSSVSSETQSQISILCQKDYFSGTVKYWNCLRNELTKIGVSPNEVSVETQYQAVEAQEPSTTYSSSGERILKEKPDMSGLNEVNYCDRQCILRRFQEFWSAELLGLFG